jgi:hypothetical protein
VSSSFSSFSNNDSESEHNEKEWAVKLCHVDSSALSSLINSKSNYKLLFVMMAKQWKTVSLSPYFTIPLLLLGLLCIMMIANYSACHKQLFRLHINF